MSDDLITIEIDGQPVKARKGALLIEVTDAADIYIPRFCYHKKLSIAANCRMCLVEVEKAAKPLPACATPVMEGMKVHTQSAAAKDAQRATMEFLLINHPLDCPICDQGGECELQDLALGYGSDVSRYTENKRVVKDKNIGPLIQTDMTRCIHCTRCVRFGTEVAGIRELGATGRSEHMQIGTYIERAVTSELSGNVIDLCPVGALTSKPYRYSARAWELRQRDGIAPHDGIGSNIYFHVKGSRVKRVVPRANEDINEVWIADRDRYSYQGFYSDDRLLTPRIKRDGQWQDADWDTALRYATAGLKNVIGKHGTEKIGVLAAATATIEELYLLQKLARGLGISNIDHRLRQPDVSDQECAPLYPALGCEFSHLERVRAALVVGSHLRKEQPLVNHRLRKAALAGARVMFVNPVTSEPNFPVVQDLAVAPSKMVHTLAGIAQALSKSGDPQTKAKHRGKDKPEAGGTNWLDAIEPSADEQAMASVLRDAGSDAIVLLGQFVTTHAQGHVLRYLAGLIGRLSGARVSVLPEAGNSAGAWLAGVIPHREAGGRKVKETQGLAAGAMFSGQLRAYVLFGIEPELDSYSGSGALQAMREADLVIAMTAYCTPAMESYADVLLPIAVFGETSGSYLNMTGAWQSVEAAVPQLGDSRPGWKLLRVLGNMFELPGFDFVSSTEVCAELRTLAEAAKPLSNEQSQPAASPTAREAGLELVLECPMHRMDAVLRRAQALQQTPDAGDGALHVNAATAQAHGLNAAAVAELRQGDVVVEVPVHIDARLPDGAVLMYSGQVLTSDLRTGEPVVLRRVR